MQTKFGLETAQFGNNLEIASQLDPYLKIYKIVFDAIPLWTAVQNSNTWMQTANKTKKRETT